MNDEMMLPVEVKSELVKFGLCLPILMNIRTAEMLRVYSYNDTMGPFLDPTAWIQSQDSVDSNHRAMKALATFQAELRKIWPEEPWQRAFADEVQS